MHTTCVCSSMRKAARAVTQFYDDQMRPSGLRATQFNILAVIRDTGEANLKQLGKEMLMDQTTLTRSLQLLEKKGLLRKVAKPDARVKALVLTARGETMFRAAAPFWMRAQQKMLSSLGERKWTAMQRDLDALSTLTRQ